MEKLSIFIPVSPYVTVGNADLMPPSLLRNIFYETFTPKKKV